jgi:hypothetical protein
MGNEKQKERDALIKELSSNYNYNPKDIYKILKDKGFKMNIHALASQIRCFRWDAIIESERYNSNEETLKLMDEYFNKYPDCYRTLSVKNLFS